MLSMNINSNKYTRKYQDGKDANYLGDASTSANDSDDDVRGDDGCAEHFYFHIMDFSGKMKQNWILIDNQSTVHMFCNRHFLDNTC